jgi:hypothetical protein
MALDILKEKGTAVDRQRFTWRELAGPTYSKLNDDAFTRVRVINMNGIESEAVRFSHSCARMNRALRPILAQVRRIEQHQQTLVNWLNPADQSPLDTTIGFEQQAIEVTAWVAQHEPDPYLAQVFRFGLLEDFDHLYRFAALMDRIEGRDANVLTQCYTDIRPGRPTAIEHRHPLDDLRAPYARTTALPQTKLNAMTILAGENQVHDYYMTVGPTFADPVARQLYAEIASIEEQHVTQYESIIDPDESWIEKWLMHEACEVYNYWSCMQTESNSRLKLLWERFLSYELGHMHAVIEVFKDIERRDPTELLPASLPDPIDFASQRAFVRETLNGEVGLSAKGERFVPRAEETAETRRYRDELNAGGSPSTTVAAGYRWTPGTELAERVEEMEGHQGRRLQ